MSSHQEQYDNWLHSQELKGRDVHREGEIRPTLSEDKNADKQH